MFSTAAGRNVKMGIYSEGGNLQPNALLSQTANFATASGMIEAALSAAITLNAGSYYWIAAISDADPTIMRVNGGGAGYALNNNSSSWPILPGTFPAGSSISTNETPTFYVVLEDI